jgi:16S rRNA (cytosine967-C5)-methyltransferase
MNGTAIVQPRAAAARVLRRVIGARVSLSNALSAELEHVDEGDSALIKELCYGGLRWHERLTALRDLILDKPLKRKDLDVGCLLELGLYQLIHMRVPAHASVHETVQAADALNKPWAKGAINAVLRTFERGRDALLESVDRRPEARLSHPRWLLERIRQAYPTDWERICAAANRHPPMTLRINCSVTTREGYLLELKSAGLAARPHPDVVTALTLESPTDVHRLPGFAAGVVSVQDAAAQLAAPMLNCKQGMRVLDACAAPGGKVAHLLESAAGDIDLTAVEIDAARAELLKDTLARAGRRPSICGADAARPSEWWDGRHFDRILLDAPCSGTGVIRRHPDIKLLRAPQDIASAQERQLRLLRALWPLLSPGGMLLYTTCSILPHENEQVIELVANECAARLLGQRQILPGDADMDGFYYARLAKGF